MKQEKLITQINGYKQSKNAVILVHNYQIPEIYGIADFIGDSLELSRKSAEIDADLIVFCGVDFMAETACILNPTKTVLLPVRGAVCPMAGMVDAESLGDMKQQYPDAAVVCYVNTPAEVKAESDICCTSSNAVKVVNSLKQNEVIFVPDKNLAAYVSRYTKKKIIPWLGWCYVHQQILANELIKVTKAHPHAEVLVHPECRPEVIDLADFVCSTSQMLKRVGESSMNEFIIGTEIGMIERLKILYPSKTFYTIPPGATCTQMKKNSLISVLESLEKEQYVITVPAQIRLKAKITLDKMLAIS